jgi:hypothetical protein
MTKPAILAALALAAAPALSQSAPKPQDVYVIMSDRGFTPREVVMRRGAPYVLHIVNRSGKGHNLTQEAFFRSARVAPVDRGWTRNGRISLRPGEHVEIHLDAPTTRRGGTYEFSSTVLGDSDDDYKGRFLIR